MLMAFFMVTAAEGFEKRYGQVRAMEGRVRACARLVATLY